MPPRLLTSSTQISAPRSPDWAASAKVPVDDTVMPMRIGLESCARTAPAASVPAAVASRVLLGSLKAMSSSLALSDPSILRGLLVDAIVDPFRDQVAQAAVLLELGDGAVDLVLAE